MLKKYILHEKLSFLNKDFTELILKNLAKYIIEFNNAIILHIKRQTLKKVKQIHEYVYNKKYFLVRYIQK